MAQQIDTDLDFKEYANETMQAYHLGISKLEVERRKVEESSEFEDTLQKFREKLSEKEGSVIGLRNGNGSELILVKEGGDLVSKKLKINVRL